jgi:hypothetical protein
VGNLLGFSVVVGVKLGVKLGSNDGIVLIVGSTEGECEGETEMGTSEGEIVVSSERMGIEIEIIEGSVGLMPIKSLLPN